MTHHPFRDAALHVFERVDSERYGCSFIARFWPYETYPVFFPGATEADARGSAEAFRAEAIAKHEAAFIAKQEAAAKARASREKKAAAA